MRIIAMIKRMKKKPNKQSEDIKEIHKITTDFTMIKKRKVEFQLLKLRMMKNPSSNDYL